MIRMFLTAGLAAALWPAISAAPAAAQTVESYVAARTACPDGWAWDQRLNKCVRIPRGSYGGS